MTGILTEVPARPRHRMVIGIGINVNNSLADAPQELRQQATSLADLAGHRFDLTAVLVLVLRQLSLRLADFADGNLRLGHSCAPWCALRGKTVSLKIGNRRVGGICQGIDDNGALIIGSDGARYVTGLVEHIDWGC